ncbi:serine/threonine-protein kinase meng-po-like [Palaemon carinicauda]|uniref:serine/threonine-protein kinase meng-po-like n=1 Tax=Palaemon carinicauda TaxID=392227 RepID=UPI0035B65BBE
MTTLARRNSSIHKVRDFQLAKVDLDDEYEVLHEIQKGWRGKLLLVEHRRTRHEVVLKAIHKDATTRIDFFREFHYNYYLSPHENILNAYDVAFEADDHYVFAQEYAPFGDLTSNTSDVGLGEINTKKIALQLASALDFMHSKDLVHRDINMDNILVFKSNFSQVKLCDFGSTRKKGTLLKKKTVWLPYTPPEIVDVVHNEGFHAETSQDVWQLGILIYVLLTGQLPWQKADLTDPNYAEYVNWRKRKTLRTPKRFTNFTSRLLRMFKRLLEPKPEKRSSVREVYKYPDDKWLVKLPRRDAGDIDNQSICYSTVSAHSCPKEKDYVLRTLKEAGIETTVDRIAKRQRIHEWLEHSLSNKTAKGEDQRALDGSTSSSTDQDDQKEDEVESQCSEDDKRLRESLRKQYQDLAALTIETARTRSVTNNIHDGHHGSAQDRKSRIMDRKPQSSNKKIDPRKGEIINSGVIVISGSIVTPVRRLSRPRAHSNSPHLGRKNFIHTQKFNDVPPSPPPRRHKQSTPPALSFESPIAKSRSYGRSDRTECGYELKHSKTYGYFTTDYSDELDLQKTSQDGSSSTDTSLASVLVQPNAYH